MLTGLVLLLVVVLGATPAGASEPAQGVSQPSGERFASLRANEVNWRTGPGMRYPIDWVYRRAGWPVQVLAEFDAWRKVRDADRIEGWVHRRMLSSRRSVVVMGETRPLHRAPDAASPLVAQIAPRNLGWLDRCEGLWCRIEVEGFQGWMRAAHLWGIQE